MPLIFGWIIQLIVFFAIVSSIAGFFSKATKNATKQRNVSDPSEVEAPRKTNEKIRRNEKHSREKSERLKDVSKYTRTKRARDRVRESYKPMIKEVVTIEDPYRAKKADHSPAFDKKKLKSAVIYKEILDKPVSMRDDW
ncbi:hypothetical protein [Alkalibacterium kapii]|uniref:Uncharacterized protein n=1 Tax=Alkalibacterium kapii TaxID=426704 RepID=A0A511AQI1_9LACT|nr:hypothetical protein [Alkalibacterium kapii]GEK90429.1 hypothetical protein AKA01nite_00510 [Alkalibacterium kapii]